MFEKASVERLKKISQKIGSILNKCSGGIYEALHDEDVLQPAIMMQFVNIDALLKGIQESNDLEALAIFTKEDIRAISTTRNIASYEYERLNLELIEIAIRDYLPILKEKIDKTSAVIVGSILAVFCTDSVMEFTWVKVPIPKSATSTPATAKKIARGRHFSPIPRRI